MEIVSYTHPSFWKCYKKLPKEIQELADKKFSLFQLNPAHPSLGLPQKAMYGLLMSVYIIAPLHGVKMKALSGFGLVPTRTITNS